jgi:adenosylhomocysteinase
MDGHGQVLRTGLRSGRRHFRGAGISLAVSAVDRTAVAPARLAPVMNVVEFQATPTQAVNVLHAMVDVLVGQHRAVVDRLTGDDTTMRRLSLPQGCEAMLLVAAAVDANRSLPATYVLTVVIIDRGQLGESELQAVLRAVEAVPFTDFEIAEIRAQLPLTAWLPRSLPPRALAGLGLFLTIHHMSDFVPMVETLLALGVDREHVTVIDKEYPYALSRRVDADLRHRLGLAVYRYSELDCAIVDHFDRMTSSGLLTLVLDDGGYVLPAVTRSHPHLVERIVGLVEQTASGIWKLDGLDLRVPVFSVAESTLKGAIESYGIADAAVRNVLALLPNTKFEGQPAVVLGFGRIGRQVAHVLRARRMRVGVYDTDLVRLVTAHEEGFLTASTATELLADQQPLVVFGTTGRGSLGAAQLDSVRRDCYLISTTSRDFEFKLDEFAQRSRSVCRRGRLGTSYRLDTGVELTVLGHGLPINFHYAESLPNRYVDLVMGAMVLGAVTLADPEHGFQPGHNVTATNHVLANSTLLRRYYQMYGPGARRVEQQTADGA